MQKTVSIKLLPSEANDSSIITKYLSSYLAVNPTRITGFRLLKKSIDARGRQVWILLTLLAFVDEPFVAASANQVNFQSVHQATKQVVIVGAGPAGLFAALKLIELGIKPIILERGKDVRARRRDLATINKEGLINPESNYCFGEGGAGTYSDGKLYTRSNKRGDINRILRLFHQFGADERILIEAHPHIGTNKLPQIITQMREQIIEAGGEVLFETKLTGFELENGRIKFALTEKGDKIPGQAFILATGHSARDIFELLYTQNILIESKPFALGVRIEHPQQLIDSIQYHCALRDPFLPPAAYSLVQQVEGRGVFSFCMCPGGIIAPAATGQNEIVVNGWSPSKRNNPFANSGMVVSIEEKDYGNQKGALSAMRFQAAVEQKAFELGGGKLVAPAQRMGDFVNKITSGSLPASSYLPGLESSDLRQVLPAFVSEALAKAFVEFGKKMRGYFTNEAVVVATESRTSSPVRIPRSTDSLQHPQVSNLYPCAEGAGYAGGIVSAAMDGERVATMIAATL
jgi:uncharacterized protein